MKVGIVGAGTSGLAAARTLKAAGCEVILWEKSRGPGGRVATRRHGDFTFDSGATSIAMRGMEIDKVILGELDQAELHLIDKPIWTHSGLRVSPGDKLKNSTSRYTYRPGNNTLGKLLAQGLDVRTEQQVETIKRNGNGFELMGEVVDALILSPPIPQTSALLWQISESRPIANARYRSCLSLMVGFNGVHIDAPYHALLEPEQRHPLTFLSLEHLKSPGRAPEGGSAFVAQMSPSYSHSNFARTTEEVLQDVLVYLHRLYPDLPATPDVVDLMRWKYSQPENVALLDNVNRAGDRLMICGDGVLAGRIESAYESGVKVARLLLQ